MAETRQRVLHHHVNLSKKFVRLFKVNNSCRRVHHLLQLMRNSLKVIEVHLFCFETTFTKKKGGGKKKGLSFFCRSLHPIPFNSCSRRLPRNYNCEDTLFHELIIRACLLLVLLISHVITFASILLCLRVFQSPFSSISLPRSRDYYSIPPASYLSSFSRDFSIPEE